VSYAIDEDFEIPTPPDDSKKDKRKKRRPEEESVRDYLQGLAAQTPIRVTIERLFPKSFGGRHIGGTLDSYDEPIATEEIRDLYGGGKYKLVIKVPNENGSWIYKAARTVEIAGDPKLSNLPTTQISTGHAEDHPTLVRDALRLQAQAAERAEQRASRAEEAARHVDRNPSQDMFLDELRAQREDNKELQREFVRLMTHKGEPSTSDVLLGRFVDGENVRMQALRTQFDSELRIKAEMHRDDVARLRDHYERVGERMEATHQREIENLKTAHESRHEAIRLAHEGLVEGLRREIRQLERDLETARSDLKELREKKEKGLVESLTEMAAVKESLEAFGGGKDAESSMVERIISSVMGSPLAEGIATRLSTAPAGVPTPSPPPQPDAGAIVRTPDGRAIVRMPDGTLRELRRKRPVPTSAPDLSDNAVSVPDVELRQALPFLENAMTAERDPIEFAVTARSLIPGFVSGNLRRYLEMHGADGLLEQIARIQETSPLLTQAGKNWTRKAVSAVLSE
jgi:hypothetical protein